MVTVQNRLIAVPQTVMNTEFPKARSSLLDAKMYLYASVDQTSGMMNIGRVCSSSSVAKELQMI